MLRLSDFILSLSANSIELRTRARKPGLTRMAASRAGYVYVAPEVELSMLGGAFGRTRLTAARPVRVVHCVD